MTDHAFPQAPWPEQDLRSKALRAPYLLDGRQRPDHPHHGVDTGLHQQRLERLHQLLGREPTPEDIHRNNHLLTAPVPF